MAQASFFCPNCQTQKLFTAHEMSHVPHILASVFLCGLWLPVWALIAATYNARYHCSVCGFSDEIRYLSNPRLRQSEMHRAQVIADRPPSQFAQWMNADGNGWKVGTLVLGVLVLLFGGFYLAVQFSDSQRKSSISQQISTAASTPMPNAEPRTSAELYRAALELIDKKPFDKVNLNKAIRYLKSIPKNAKEYRDAEKLIKLGKQKGWTGD